MDDLLPVEVIDSGENLAENVLSVTLRTGAVVIHKG
jgi:hypothetical protein